MAQMAMAGASAIMQIRAAQAQKAMYGAKAAQAKIQGRAKALEHKAQGLEVLRRLNETLATTTSRASTGGGVENYAMKEGTREYYTSKDNSLLAVGQADYQAQIYRTAGKQAMLNGYANAMGTLGQGYVNQQQVGWPT